MKASLTRREWMGTAAALACAGAGTATIDDRAQKIADIVRKARAEHGLAAVLCGVWSGDAEVAALAVGESMTHVPATTDMHLRTGGVTITCVCTLLLQLVDEGKVGLDDKLSRWLPKLPQAGDVTLRMLANSTSAIPTSWFRRPSSRRTTRIRSGSGPLRN